MSHVNFQQSPCMGEVLNQQVGPLMEGPQCHMSILRNYHVPCHYFGKFHVNFNKVPCHMLILRNTPRYVDYKMIPCRMSIFKNTSCHVVFFPSVARLHVAYQF